MTDDDQEENATANNDEAAAATSADSTPEEGKQIDDYDESGTDEAFKCTLLSPYMTKVHHILPKKVSEQHAYVSIVWDQRKSNLNGFSDPAIIDAIFPRRAHVIYCNNDHDRKTMEKVVSDLDMDVDTVNVVPVWVCEGPTIFVVNPGGRGGAPVSAYTLKPGRLNKIKKTLQPIQNTYIFTSTTGENQYLVVYAVSENDANIMIDAYTDKNAYSLTESFSGERKYAVNAQCRVIV